MKENLLLLKDSLEPWKLKFISIQLQFQKMSDNLDNIVNNYNNTYHNTIKMKPVDVKSITYIDSSILYLYFFVSLKSLYRMVVSVYIYIYIYIYICRLCKNYCFPNESCRKAGRNYCKFQAETRIKISK